MSALLDYTVLTNKNPILRIRIQNVALLPPTVGETAVYISRVGSPEEVRYPLLEKNNSVFSFVLTGLVLKGRYQARIVYNGVSFKPVQFIYKPAEVEAENV